ncbi:MULTISPECIES: OmpH family outer membrane protein [Salinimicrobium]|jgi:outer membrane protein|uniref:OmpH family outer membrane protein n=1 Tax=Salinimicrobium TaxID=561367 RepID=UPI001E3693B2|nr:MULTISPECIES: OmpH family outer membrane protein [Salinimicrobium]MCC8359930.1 OmpH family outer membrane protein [Salinimicrobium sediminilitoris]MCY2685825.1 OmpH family outer membrane protein [Salinimicrobium sp. TH3]
MKQFKTLLIAVALILGASSFANAQTKVAHIATQELIEQMPSYKTAMNQLEKLQKTYDTQIKEMVTEAQGTMKRYEAEAQTKTDEENQKRALELQQTQRSIGEYRQTAEQDLRKKEVDLLKPVFEKARTTIQKVARAKEFDYVLDSTTGTGVIMADGYDLMPDVKKELGI